MNTFSRIITFILNWFANQAKTLQSDLYWWRRRRQNRPRIAGPSPTKAFFLRCKVRAERTTQGQVRLATVFFGVFVITLILLAPVAREICACIMIGELFLWVMLDTGVSWVPYLRHTPRARRH